MIMISGKLPVLNLLTGQKSAFSPRRGNLLHRFTCNSAQPRDCLITDNLKPTRQCQQAYSKASKALRLIGRTISFKSKDVLLRLYKTLVRPHLEYCSSAWSPYYEKDKFLLERVQHRFARMVPGLKLMSYESRLGLWTLEERRHRADLLEVLKMYKGLTTTPFTDFFSFSTVAITRGHSAELEKHHCHLELRRHFFSMRVVDRWK